MQKHNRFQTRGLLEVDVSEELAEQAKLIQNDITGLRTKYKEMMQWKQNQGTKMNFKSFKELTSALKLN